MNKAEISAMLARHEKNFKKMQDKDAKAKAKGALKGRYIREPIADGAAYYEIIRVNKNSVRIRVITSIGDDWVIPYWGSEASIEKAYAQKKVQGRDALAKMFGKEE